MTKGVWWSQRSENKGRRDAAPGAARAAREPIPVFSARTRDTERHSNDEPGPCSRRTDCRRPGPRRSERRTIAIGSGPPGTFGSAEVPVGFRWLICPSDAHRESHASLRRGNLRYGCRGPVRSAVMRFRAGASEIGCCTDHFGDGAVVGRMRRASRTESGCWNVFLVVDDRRHDPVGDARG